MEQAIILNWEGPFKINEHIPKHLIGAVGIYVFECDSSVVYVGKAETQGAFKRLKDHFRGDMDHTGKCVMAHLGNTNKDKVNIWLAWMEEEKAALLIGDAEKLVIFNRNPSCNRTNREKYDGKPLHIINVGNHPKELPKEIHSHV
jgi:hypothetical protein